MWNEWNCEMSKVLLLEFNELCPDLMNRWIGEGLLPNFKRLRDRSDVYLSRADVDEPRYLEPWIQWYSLHTGLPYEVHKVFHLTDGPKADYEDIWSFLERNGKRTASGGSMNVKGFVNDAFYLPDPWCTTENIWPASLDIYSKVVSRYVQEYTAGDVGLSLADYAKFGICLIRNGLRPTTVWSIVRQLISERIAGEPRSWRRVSLLDSLQLDLFRSLYKRYQPDFASFFLNSTAHFQHAYWRHMDPSVFEHRPSSEELLAYGHAIRFGYQQMDKILGDLVNLVDDRTLIVFATALSQQPFTKAESVGGQLFYRPKNVTTLLASLDICPDDVQPTMTHQYMLRFSDRNQEEAARQRLMAVTLNGKPIFGVESRQGERALYFGNTLHAKVPENAVLIDEATNQSFAYYDCFYQIDAMKSGCHHPDGILWIATGQHRDHPEPVSILDVFPTIADYFDLKELPQGLSGRSLLKQA